MIGVITGPIMAVIVVSSMAVTAVGMTSCSQHLVPVTTLSDPELKRSSNCENVPLLSFRHLLDGEYLNTHIGDIPQEVLIAERILLFEVAMEGAVAENFTPEEIEQIMKYYSLQVPDPDTNMQFYKTLNLTSCVSVF